MRVCRERSFWLCPTKEKVSSPEHSMLKFEKLPRPSGLNQIRDEIDRLFETPLAQLTRTTQLLTGWTPPIDLFEDKDHFIVRAELAGMKKEDIDLRLHEGSLSISGERKSEDKYQDAEVYRAER